MLWGLIGLFEMMKIFHDHFDVIFGLFYGGNAVIFVNNGRSCIICGKSKLKLSVELLQEFPES